MEIQRDKQFYPLDTLGEAVRLIHEHCPTMNPEAVLTFFPVKPHWSDRIIQREILSYQFFDQDGKNIASYVPCMTSLSIFVRPRVWGIAKEGFRSVQAHFPQIA